MILVHSVNQTERVPRIVSVIRSHWQSQFSLLLTFFVGISSIEVALPIGFATVAMPGNTIEGGTRAVEDIDTVVGLVL